MKKFGYIVLLAIALAPACNKEKDNPQPKPIAPKIDIPAESQAVFSQGISWDTAQQAQSQTVKFTTNQPWTADVTDTKASSWLSVQPTSGTAGTVNLTVSAQPNPTTEEREALVTIKCGTATQKFSVKQAGLPKVTSVTLDKAELALVEGDEYTLTATVLPDNAADKTVTWSTSSAEVVTVEDGKVTAVKEGEATITAKAGEIEATCKVTVAKKIIPVESVTLDKAELALVKGDEVTLTATVKPDDATDKAVTWTTSNEAVATVADGKVKAVGGGSATITAKAGDQSASCTITVTVPVSSVSLDKTSLGLTEGDEAQLAATVGPEDATDKTVTWSSDKPAIATVDNAGKVKAVSPGTAIVTAKAGEKSATCTVTVAKKVIPVSSVTLDKTALELVEGDQTTLSATVKPDDATDKTVTWSSSNAAIATVENGKVVAVKEGSAVITAKAGDKTATCTVAVAKKVIPVSSITLDKASLALTKGEEATLTATVSPADATDKTVTWSTSDAKVVTVEGGKVKAVGGGEATVTAKAGDKSASCTIQVTVPVGGISLDNASVALKEGQEIQLTAIVSPNDATDKTVTWSSDKTSVATVDNSGKVKAVAEGSATITAKAGDKSATCTVSVSKNIIAVTSVTLDKASLDLIKGADATLTATVKPDDATNKSVTWSTSDADVATVENGKVKAVGGGNATITAKAGEKSASCTVKVTVPVSSVSLDKTTLEITEGDQAQLTATVNPADATDPTVTWSSDKTGVATVDNTGKVKAVSPGTATITAKAGEKSATCTVTVAKLVIPATGLSLSPANLELYETEQKYVSVNLIPATSTDWPEFSSEHPEIATVNGYGKVTGVAAGTSVITARIGSLSSTCTVTVKTPTPVESITLNKEETTIEKGQAETLTATILPQEATFKSVTWTSSNNAVATVNSSGQVTARTGGEATITATSSNGLTATCHVKVVVSVQSVTLSPAGDLELNVGSSASLTASVSPSDATDKTVTWESGDITIATVENGVVTGVAKGGTTITARAGGKSATINVNVVVPASGVTLDQTSLNMTKTQEVTLVATVNPGNASNKTVSWTSSNTAVATVDANGKVKAVGGGEATITATTHNGKTATCAVTVTVPLIGISLDKTEKTLALDDSFTLTVQFNPGDATNKTVTWEVGSPTTASITPNGITCTVKGLAVGNTTVTVRSGSLSATCAITVVDVPFDNSEGYGSGNGQWDN